MIYSRHIVKSILVGITFLSGVFAAHGTDSCSHAEILERLRTIHQKMTLTKNVRLEFETIYKIGTEGRSEEKKIKGRYLRKGTKIYSSVAGITIIQDEKIRVSMDSSDKTMMVSLPDLLQTDQPFAPDSLVLARVLYCNKSENALQLTYVLQLNPEEEITELIFIFNKQQEFIEEIRMKFNPVYGENLSQVTRYLECEFDRKVDNDVFDTGNYVHLEKGNYVLGKKYPSYTLRNTINHRNE